MKRLAAVLLALMLGCCTEAFAQAKASTETANSLHSDFFRKIRPELLEKTTVPLRLPSYLGADVGEKDKIYAILKYADPSKYEIQLALDPTCTGGNWCHGGSVKGSKHSIPSDYEGRRKSSRVSLAQGIIGTFTEARCFAYCEESVVSWKQNGYYYEIGVKAGRKLELVKIANSAIANTR